MHIFSSFFTQILGTLIYFTGDWFFAVALLTIGVKVLLFPLSIKQQRSQLLSANLNQAKSILSNKFHDKTEKVNTETLKIASRYKVNSFIFFVPLIIQTPIFFSLYFSVLNLSSSVGSFLIPWISGLHSMDNLHILPVIAGLFQGLNGFTVNSKNVLTLIIPIFIGVVFLWKAPAALSAYWITNSILRLVELRIFSIKIVKQKFFNVPTPEQMLEGTI